MAKHLVIREIGSQDPQQFAVVTHGQALDGRWTRKCLWIEDWFENEDAARACAHRLEYPD